MRDFWFVLSLVISGGVLVLYAFNLPTKFTEYFFGWPVQIADENNFGWGLLLICVAGVIMCIFGLREDRKAHGDQP